LKLLSGERAMTDSAKPHRKSAAAGTHTQADPITGASVSPGVSVAGGGLSIPISPGVFAPSSKSSLFDRTKPGKAIVRPHDLLALRIELINMQISPGSPPVLTRGGAGPAFIVLHFPPQSIAEEVFFETAQPGVTNPDLPEPTTPKRPDPPDPQNAESSIDPPPIRARIADESRVVFKVPNDFSAPYTLSGVLDACKALSLNVPANALPPGAGAPIVVFPGPRVVTSSTARLNARARVSLAGLSLRAMSIAAVEGPQSSTLAARASTGLASIQGAAIGPVISALFRPQPAPPLGTETAIEMPWRLILAPHGQERFTHTSLPATSPLTQRTELWHSRLIAPAANGEVIEPPRADPQRTTRAVWALPNESSDTTKPLKSAFPESAELPPIDPATTPFLATLDDFDRHQIVHLSSNFGVSGYQPNAMDTHLMMLSSLGGWLDLRGAWDPPGLSLEEWVHRASMGRDHYVRLVYKGFLYPFGHRVSLVKVSERKFHNGRNNTSVKPGNAAYLRQRLFIIVRERDRTFVNPELFTGDGKSLQRQFPFNHVRILTAVTPNLDLRDSAPSKIAQQDVKMFWPSVNGAPFKFRCVGTDIDGSRLQFELPMIFMDNSLASPRKRQGKRLVADFDTAEVHASAATAEWLSRSDGGVLRRTADFKRQRLALAPSVKAGDTAAEMKAVEFGGECRVLGSASSPLRAYSDNLSRPVFYPSVRAGEIHIAALTQLTGAASTNTFEWHDKYLKDGFDAPDVDASAAKNKGQIFAKIGGDAKLDFSTQGDRSGGFVMPNLKPSGLSRLSGPVSGPLDKLTSGAGVAGTEMFPSSLSDLPLPLLFGCIPLGEILKAMTGGGDKLPNFASEASSKLEAFFNALTRGYQFVEQIGEQSGSLAQAATDAVKQHIEDLIAQAVAVPAAEVAQVKTALNQAITALDALRSRFDSFVMSVSGGPPSVSQIAAMLTPANAANLNTNIDAAIAELDNVRNKALAATLPSGFKQSVLSMVAQAKLFLNDIKTVVQLIADGSALFTALGAIVEDGAIFADPGALATKLEQVRTPASNLRNTVAGFRLLEGAPKKTIVAALDAIAEILGAAGDIAQIIENLLGDELVIRFDWKPEIDNWALPGENKDKDPIFRANDKHGFVVAVEAKVKKSGGSPKINVVCSLKRFDLILIAPAGFMELNFEKIEFSVDQSAKMNVDVLLSDIKFIGPLSFVETLKDLIPLDGFSDPPYLDITPQGIDAGFSLALPNIAVGMFSLTNLSLGAGFTVPFIGQPLSVRFNFCTREQPFNLTVTLFGGGGFFGVTIDPHGVQILEAAFEFGASISVDFGVASGGVHVMAGVYFRMEKSAASLTGYFRLGGHVSVLCIVSASLELYLELRYEFESGKCVGKATLTIEVSVFMFSISVKITCERKFAGSNGDPTFREIMGAVPALPLADELLQIQPATQYAWREYCEAFA
jgi:hypothetical protein